MLRRRQWWGKTGFVVVFLALWFGTLDERELFNPDEGRYAEIPREMVATGDWITPRLNGLKYFEKPALQYWITAAAYNLLGEQEWTARLWPAVSGFLTLLVVYATGHRLAGRPAGVIAALLLASTFQFFLFSQLLTLDMGLTLFLTLAVAAFLAAEDTRGTAAARRNWMLLAWAAMGLAVQSKGLVGIVLPALTIAGYALLTRDWKLVGRLQWRFGLLVFAAVVLPWFVTVQLRNPEFFEFFFIREHFARYALDNHHRTGAWYYFLVILVVGALPWSLAYGKALVDALRMRSPPHFPVNPYRLLTLWIAVILVFYSASASKLPGYILPVFPAFALLAACSIHDARLLPQRWHLVAMAVGGLALVGVAPFVVQLPKFAAHADRFAPYAPWIVAGGLAIAATAALAGLVRRWRPALSLPVAAFGMLIAFQLLLTGTEAIENEFSPEGLVEMARENIGEFDSRVPFYSVDMYDQVLPLHVGRTLTVVNFRGELAMGIAQEPALAVPDIAEFRRRWVTHVQAYAVMPVPRFAEEEAARTPMSLLARDRRTVIVSRNAVAAADIVPRGTDR